MEPEARHFYELTRDSMPGTEAWYILNDSYSAHFHSAIEVAYVLDGAICVLQNGESHLVQKGYMIVNSSYLVHGYSTPEASSIIVAVIPLSVLPSLRGVFAQNHFAAGVTDVRGCKEYASLMRMMADPALCGNQRFVDSIAEALLYLLIEHVGLEQNQSDAGSDFIKRILVYVQEHAAEPLSIPSVAAHFGYSAGRFSHIFNQRVGCPFPRYVNSTRCDMARRLLETGAVPLMEVAEACGFSSMRTFHRAYKRYTGETPMRRGTP